MVNTMRPNIRKYFLTTLLILILLSANHSTPGLQNEIRLDLLVSPDSIDIFFINDFDFDDASSNPQILKYRISSSTYPQTMKIEMGVNATIPKLDWNNNQILFLSTRPFVLNAPISISIREIDRGTEEYIDEIGNAVRIEVESFERMEGIMRDNFALATLMSGGELPAGIYAINVLVRAVASEVSVIYGFDNPIRLDAHNSIAPVLVSPGGPPEDMITTSTRYPVFEWVSEGCKYGIRVSEYNKTKHETLEDALSDVSNLPFPDNGGYFMGENGEGLEGTTYNYQTTIAKELDWGKTYVWAVINGCQSTSGTDVIASEIFAFTVVDERDDGGFFSCSD